MNFIKIRVECFIIINLYLFDMFCITNAYYPISFRDYIKLVAQKSNKNLTFLFYMFLSYLYKNKIKMDRMRKFRKYITNINIYYAYHDIPNALCLMKISKKHGMTKEHFKILDKNNIFIYTILHKELVYKFINKIYKEKK